MPNPLPPNSRPATRWRASAWLALASAATVLCGVACTPVAPYERVQLNDADMELASRDTETFEHNVEAYREGASGANGGKIGGGCGCN